jgi:hypothetical protein
MPLQAFDVDEPQVLGQDDSGSWQDHLLLRRLEDAEWVTLSGSCAVRILGLASVALVPLGESLAQMRPVDPTQLPEWPHHGPRAVIELLRGVHALGLTMLTYHAHWARTSSVHEAPNFPGLSKMVEQSMDEGGGIATRDLTGHMAARAESEALVLKLNRLLQGELEAKRVEKGLKKGGSGQGAD